VTSASTRVVQPRRGLESDSSDFSGSVRGARWWLDSRTVRCMDKSNMIRRCERNGLRSIGVLVAALAPSLMACASEAPVEESGSSTSAIVRNDIMIRGRSWVDERVPYSQSNTHKNQYGTYRTDCSGYVSMAWALGQSRTTYTLWDVTKQIGSADLQPGDALLKDSGGTDHVALFVRWAGQGRPVVWEEYSSGHPAEERTWEGLRGFTPVRYTGTTGTASGSAGKGMPVLVTWNGVPSSEASLDVILTGGRTISPCVAVDTRSRASACRPGSRRSPRRSSRSRSARPRTTTGAPRSARAPPRGTTRPAPCTSTTTEPARTARAEGF
jgi:hypothetical protein